MTGYGQADAELSGRSVHVEARSVNNRYLKLGVRLTEGYASLESRIEALVREKVRRGTLQLNVHIHVESSGDQYKINSDVLESYLSQLTSTFQRLNLPQGKLNPESLLALPGVIDEQRNDNDSDETWPAIKSAVTEAITALVKMRADEGQAMAKDLQVNATTISAELDQIADRAPIVVENFRDRLQDRLNSLLEEYDVKVDTHDLVREVGVFAERADISEEIVRLRSHLDQFGAAMTSKDGAGRRMEFLVQEMLRETNTIGSKANDAAIAKHVVEIKTVIERMREMVQNIE